MVDDDWLDPPPHSPISLETNKNVTVPADARNPGRSPQTAAGPARAARRGVPRFRFAVHRSFGPRTSKSPASSSCLVRSPHPPANTRPLNPAYTIEKTKMIMSTCCCVSMVLLQETSTAYAIVLAKILPASVLAKGLANTSPNNTPIV